MSTPGISVGPSSVATGAGLPPVRKGEPVTAKAWNDVVGTVNAQARGAIAGIGLQGLVAAALASIEPEAFVQVRIVAVHVPAVHAGDPAEAGMLGIATPQGNAFWPSTVLYDLEGIGEPGMVLANQKPTIGGGRPVMGDECRIYAVPVGTLGVIIRSPAKDNEGGVDADFVLIGRGEVPARRRCGQ